jgi:N-acyl-D-amino-acid deacylase
MTLAEIASSRGTDPAETAMDLILEDGTRVEAVYFAQSEGVVRQATALPWMSFCSDAAALAAEGKTLDNSAHPRAYGSFARLFARYVREEQALSLAEAIRRNTSFPAENLSIQNRGRLKAGYFADVVVFDPDTIQDHATFEQPHQYATGVDHVLVNGVQVLENGEHTGATPGRFVRGPGYTGPDSS